MSHTTRRRVARLAAGLAVTAGATATTLLGAAPAHAQNNAVTAVVAGGGTLVVTGTFGPETITAENGNGVITVSSSTAITPQFGCQPAAGGRVVCIGVNFVKILGLGGADVLRNNSLTQSELTGGAGNDRLIGGSANDRLFGGTGTNDEAVGNGGFDTCVAQKEFSCEK